MGRVWGVYGARAGNAWGVLEAAWGLRGRAWGVWGGNKCYIRIARTALLSGYLGESGHLPR